MYKVCRFNLLNKPIARGIAIFLVIWITNFNLTHWSGTYRWLLHEGLGGLESIEHESCIWGDCGVTDMTFKMETNAWNLELWLKEESYLIYCCVISPCISLFLLEFKGSKLMSEQDDGSDSNFLRNNREIIHTSINILTAFFVAYKTWWDEVVEEVYRTTWGIIVIRWVGSI